MTPAGTMRAPLRWETLTRADGVVIEQARARNNSWYLVVPAGDSYELRYASQSANAHILSTRDIVDAKRAADTHADRYDTRA